MKKFIFLLSHPIQYFSPLFQKMAQDPNIDLIVLYCSDENVKGYIDKGFGVEVKWDIDLLKGYNYKFLKNKSWKPSLYNGFCGLINFEIFSVLKKEKDAFLVIHGWNYFTNFLAVIAAKLYGLKLCLKGENPLNQELLKLKSILLLRKLFFKYLFFPVFDYYFYIGSQNKKLYEYYGVKKKKLIFTPYAVDNQRFRYEYENYKDKKLEIRKELGLPDDKIILLTSGKYINKKRPMDLLKAFYLIKNANAALVFLGDGKLRKEMEEYVKTNNLKNVFLTGFKNQSEIGKYFASADIFVLPSGSGETWGLVVNEAMNFGLPVIISDTPGSSYDLVTPDWNGYTYKTGDVEMLSENLDKLLISSEKRELFGSNSLKKIQEYSYEIVISNIISTLQ